MRTLFWPTVAATLGVYLVMVLWSLPRISAAAGGLPPFDLRPRGYSFDDARAFLAALPAPEVEFYRRVQLRLDIIYPALFALTVGWAILRLAPRWRFRPWLALPPLAAALFDWLENAAIARMLTAGADSLTPDLAARASAFSQGKAAAATAALGVLLGLCIRAALIRRRSRRSS